MVHLKRPIKECIIRMGDCAYTTRMSHLKNVPVLLRRSVFLFVYINLFRAIGSFQNFSGALIEIL